MSSHNERRIADCCRQILLAAAVKDAIGESRVAEMLATLKDVITEGDDGFKHSRRTKDFYSYTGLECRSYALNECNDEADPVPMNSLPISVCNARRLNDLGRVIQLTAKRGNETVLEIYYDYTLTEVLQPCVDPETGKLMGFCKAATDPLCGQNRLRQNLKMFADNGQQHWEERHKFEVQPEFCLPSPKYDFSGALWDRLCAKFYALHPRGGVTQAVDNGDIVADNPIDRKIADLESQMQEIDDKIAARPPRDEMIALYDLSDKLSKDLEDLKASRDLVSDLQSKIADLELQLSDIDDKIAARPPRDEMIALYDLSDKLNKDLEVARADLEDLIDPITAIAE